MWLLGRLCFRFVLVCVCAGWSVLFWCRCVSGGLVSVALRERVGLVLFPSCDVFFCFYIWPDRFVAFCLFLFRLFFVCLSSVLSHFLGFLDVQLFLLALAAGLSRFFLCRCGLLWVVQPVFLTLFFFSFWLFSW